MPDSTKKKPGVLIVISGPSATGKGTVCKSLMSRNSQLQFSVSVTTREPRNGEVEGKNYYFRIVKLFGLNSFCFAVNLKLVRHNH